MEAYRKLRRIEQLFVDLYVKHRGRGADAVREMRPSASRPREIAWRFRRRPGVKEAIAEVEEQAILEAGINRVETLQQLARIAHFDHRKLFDAEGKPLPVHQLPDEVATALAGIEVEELFEGRGEERQHVGRIHKYRTASQVEALKLLMQYQKLLVDRHEHTGRDGGPIETSGRLAAEIRSSSDPAEAARLYSELVAGDHAED